MPKIDNKRPLDTTIMIQARSIISQARPGKKEKEMYDKLNQLFKTGPAASDPRLQSARFKQLMNNHITPDCVLKKKLVALRDSSADNRGNRNKGSGKAKTEKERDQIDKEVRKLMASHQPGDNGDSGTPFWIRESDATKNQPDRGTLSKCGGVKFPATIASLRP